MNTQPESLRLAHVSDPPIPPDWSDMVAAVRDLLRLHAENEALQQVYDATQKEIEQLEIEALRMRSAEPVGEYPAITTEFINKHAHPSQAAKLCREDWSGKDESSVETVQPEVIKLLHAYVDADRAMRAQADSQPAPVLGTIAHVGTGKTTLTGAITSALRAASTEADNVTAPAGATSNTHWNQAPCAHCGCTEGQHFITRCHHIQGETRYTPTQQADSQPAKVWDYPPMPDFDTVEQHIYGACRRYITQDMLEPIHNLIRDVIDADRAAQQGAGRGGADVPAAAIWPRPYRGRRRVPFG